MSLCDRLRAQPAQLEAGEYVLGLRYDCEASAQVWLVFVLFLTHFDPFWTFLDSKTNTQVRKQQSIATT